MAPSTTGHFVLSGDSMTRVRHENVMSIVMNGKYNTEYRHEREVHSPYDGDFLFLAVCKALVFSPADALL